MKDRLFDAIRKSKADYTEIRYELEDTTSICYRGKEADDVSSSKLRGGIVRACTRGGWGIATFDCLADLDHSVAAACESAALVGREKTQLAAVPPVNEMKPAKLQRDFRGVAMDEKLRLVQCYNDIVLRADPSIATTVAVYRDIFRTVHFASSHGTYYCEDRPRADVFFNATARQGDLVQQAWDGRRSTVSYDGVLGLESLAEQAAKRAAALLKAPPCQGGTHTVILDPDLGGVFAHEAFGHLSEADFLYENPKMRDLMHLGRPMGVKQLNIIDDGSFAGYAGTHAFDDEGTPTAKTYLIKDGVLAGHLHSLETAAKMGARPTGNARTMDRTRQPIIRMTNTYIDNGDLPFEQLIRDIDSGIYACQCLGGQTMMEQFTFSAGYGYRIEKGKVAELIRDVVLTGNVFTTLNRIDGFGNDLMISQDPGMCGKNGQGVPVTTGSPHLRIRDVVVGGK